MGRGTREPTIGQCVPKGTQVARAAGLISPSTCSAGSNCVDAHIWGASRRSETCARRGGCAMSGARRGSPRSGSACLKARKWRARRGSSRLAPAQPGAFASTLDSRGAAGWCGTCARQGGSAMSGATHELGVCAAVRPEAQYARATGMCLSAGSVCDYRATKYQNRKHTSERRVGKKGGDYGLREARLSAP